MPYEIMYEIMHDEMMGFRYVWLEGSFGLLEEDDIKTLWDGGLPAAAAAPAPAAGTSTGGSSTEDPRWY